MKCRHYHEKGFCQYGPRCQFLHNDRKGEIRKVKLEYSQLMRIMGDAFLLAENGHQEEKFNENLIGLEKISLTKLSVFEAIRGAQ